MTLSLLDCVYLKVRGRGCAWVCEVYLPLAHEETQSTLPRLSSHTQTQDAVIHCPSVCTSPQQQSRPAHRMGEPLKSFQLARQQLRKIDERRCTLSFQPLQITPRRTKGVNSCLDPARFLQPVTGPERRPHRLPPRSPPLQYKALAPVQTPPSFLRGDPFWIKKF